LRVTLWEAVLYTSFVFALDTYAPDLAWQAFLAAYVVLLLLWVAAIRDLRKRWRAFMQRHFPGL